MKLLCYLLLACLMPAYALEWAPNLEEAKQRAAAQNKLVLLVYYGVPYTRNFANMRERLMDSEEFCAYAEDKFVPVEMIECADRSQTQAILAHRAVGLHYGINAYPTTLVLTPQGVPTAGFRGIPGVGPGYTEDYPMNYLRDVLDNGIITAEKLREAEAMPEGEEKLRCLVAAYGRFPSHMRAANVFAKYIADMDPENKTGMMDEYLNIRQMIDWYEIDRYANVDVATSRQRKRDLIARARPANLEKMLEQYYFFQVWHIYTVEDVHEICRTVEQWLPELEKKSPEEAQKRREKHARNYGGDPEEVVRRKTEQREERKRASERRKREREEARRAAEEAAKRALWRNNILVLPPSADTDKDEDKDE